MSLRNEEELMTLTFWMALLFSAPVTALLLGPASPIPGFGNLPGDFHFSGDGIAVILPFASSSLVLVALYGAFSLAGDSTA
jgi:hypothetical protein